MADKRIDQLIRENERLVLAARAGHVGIWEMDFSDQQFIWDDQMHAVYGLPPGTFSGKLDDWIPLLHPEDLPRVLTEWGLAITETSVLDTEFRALHPSGAIVYVRALAQVIRGPDGTPLRALGTNRDVTVEHEAADALRKAKEAAETAERAKGEFLAVMSHEIRTPMNTVLGMTRLALQTELTPRQRNYLNKIDLSARSLIAILNDILDFSKIEAGKMALEETAFTLESVLESVSAVTAMKAEEKGLEIAYAVAPGVPDRIIGDPLRLGQVLINLLNNAVKFTERGEVVVSIALDDPADTRADEGRVMLRFAVRDTGIGLDASQLERVFQAFSQTENHIFRKYGGTGLGLTICRQLVELMGGRIWAEGEPGRGSTFTFTLDAKLLPAPLFAPAPTNTSAGLTGRRVLIVDDNSSAQEILALMVRRFGMDTTVTSSGASALSMLRDAWIQTAPFELVLMDWRMPGMDGLEAARLIKHDPDLVGTPAVLMVTAFGREEILQRAQQLGLQGVLIKPVTESVMFNTIADALGCAHADGEAPTPRPRRDLARLRGRRVLLVEDNALNRELATELLQHAGVIVETAASGLEAIASVRSSVPDLVLMDCEMPGMDGLAATRDLRRDVRFTTLPILAMTAHASRADRQACLDAGMNDHIIKPIDPDRLYDALLRGLPPEPRLAGLAGRRVLVVDDNALNREVASDFLLAAGMRVDAAVDGYDAIARVTATAYDLVLMDIHMPKMDGLTAAREIRKQPHLVDLPIVALTAQAQTVDREASLAAGMNAHLTKPIDEARLYNTLLQVLSGQLSDGTGHEATWARPAAGAVGSAAIGAGSGVDGGDASATDGDHLPASLPGIDLASALSLLGGRRALLLRLLRSFARDFADAPARLRAAHAANRSEEIAALAHTVKSAAAYLGAASLSEAADLLEAAARRGSDEAVAERVLVFGGYLDAVLHGLRDLFAKTGSPPAPHNPAIDVQAIVALIAEAAPLVARGDYAAVARLDDIGARLAGTSLADLADAVRNHFEEIELDAASASLQRLRTMVAGDAPW